MFIPGETGKVLGTAAGGGDPGAGTIAGRVAVSFCRHTSLIRSLRRATKGRWSGGNACITVATMRSVARSIALVEIHVSTGAAFRACGIRYITACDRLLRLFVDRFRLRHQCAYGHDLDARGFRR